MEKLISKETESDLAKLGLYQIFGGLAGIFIILWSIYENPLLASVFSFVSFLFAYSIYCGILCLKTKKNALWHSLINQILQVCGFAIMGFAFKYVAGFFLTIDLDLTDSIKFDFHAGTSMLKLYTNNDMDRLEVDINLIALGLIYWIDKLMKRVKEESAIRQAS